MEKSDFSLSKSGTAVWARVSGLWWPGEITTDYPKQLLNEKKEKEKICVVKFCQENDYQAIFKQSEIKLYTLEDREDLIRKGLNKLKSGKPGVLESFKEDVKNAENLIGGDPHILETINLTPQAPKRPIYAGLFKSAPAASSVANTPKRGRGQIQFPFHKKPAIAPSPKKSRASDAGGTSTSTSTSIVNSDKLFRCETCDFGTDRIGALTAHLRSHSSTSPYAYKPVTPANSTPIVSHRLSSKTQVYTPSSLVTPTKQKSVPVAEVAPSPKKTPPKKSPVKSKEVTKSAQKTLPPKKRKITREVGKKEILADWVEEESNEQLKDESSNLEKSDEEDSVVEAKVPRKTDKEIQDTFEALLNATKAPERQEGTEAKEPSGTVKRAEAVVAPLPAIETHLDKVLKSESDKLPELDVAEKTIYVEEKQSGKESTEVSAPPPIHTRGRRGAETRRSGTPKESDEQNSASSFTTKATSDLAATPKTRSSMRNQEKAKNEAKTDGSVNSKKMEKNLVQPESKRPDKDDELLNAAEELLNETKMSETRETTSRLPNFSTKPTSAETASESEESNITTAVKPKTAKIISKNSTPQESEESKIKPAPKPEESKATISLLSDESKTTQAPSPEPKREDSQTTSPLMKADERRETSPKRGLASERAARSSPPKSVAATQPAVTSPEKTELTLKSPVKENEKSAKSPVKENEITLAKSPVKENEITSGKSPVKENEITLAKSPVKENEITSAKLQVKKKEATLAETPVKEKETALAKSAVKENEKSAKSPPLPKLIPTPSFQVQSATVASASSKPTQQAIIKQSTNNKPAEVLQQTSTISSVSPAVSSSMASASASRGQTIVKVVGATPSAPSPLSTPPKLVPVGSKPRVLSSQSTVSQQVIVSTSSTAPKPSSTVKVQVTSSPPKLVAAPGVSFVTPNEKVVVSQIIPATTTSNSKPTISSISSTTTTAKVLISTAVTTNTKSTPSTAAPASAKVLVTSATPPRPIVTYASTSNNIHSAARSPAAILSRTPQRPLMRGQVPGKGASVPNILGSQKATPPVRSTTSQALFGTATAGAGQQVVVATKSAPDRPAPTIAFAQKSTVPQVAVTSLAPKSAPTASALMTSQITASKQVAAGLATAVKSTVPASPKPPNILAQKSTVQAIPKPGNVMAQKSTVVPAASTSGAAIMAPKPTVMAAASTSGAAIMASKPTVMAAASTSGVAIMAPKPTVMAAASSSGAMVMAPKPTVPNISSPTSHTNTTSTAQKSPVSSLPPLGPPPPIPGIATSVSQEMLLAAAAQPSTSKKRPYTPKAKPVKSPKRTKPDTPVSTAVITTVANTSASASGQQNLVNDNKGVIQQAPEGAHPALQIAEGQGGDNGSGVPEPPNDQVDQMIHLLPVQQPDGTTSYILIHVNEDENGHQTMQLDQTGSVQAPIVSQNDQDQDRVGGIYLDRASNLEEVIAAVHEQERLQNENAQASQVAPQNEVDTSNASANPTIGIENMADIQQHLANNGGQYHLIDDGNGGQIIASVASDETQQFLLDPSQLQAIAAAGGDPSGMFYLVDINGESQYIQLVDPSANTSEPAQ